MIKWLEYVLLILLFSQLSCAHAYHYDVEVTSKQPTEIVFESWFDGYDEPTNLFILGGTRSSSFTKKIQGGSFFVSEHVLVASKGLLPRAQSALDDLLRNLPNNRLPATAIGAVDRVSGRVVAATSGSVPTNVNPVLQQLADRLGGLGVRTACGNTLGRCAEFRAANELLNQGARLEDIIFTNAIRPRTGQVIPRCQNCVNIFGVE